MSGRKEWMLGIPGHNELVSLEAVLLLVRGGQLRPTDLVKKLGEPWRAANEVGDLMSHFSDVPGQAIAKPAIVVEAPPKESARSSEPIRSTTDKVPRMLGGGKTPDSSKSIPKFTTPKPAEERSAEDRAPIRSITSRVPTASAPKPVDSAQGKPFDSAQGKPFDSAQGKPTPPPPAATAVKEELRTETKRTPLAAPDHDKTDKISARKAAGAKREPPKPPPKPEPLIEPMAAKYYSPVDMLRGASLAFEPKKLCYSWPVVFLFAIWSIGMYASAMRGGAAELPLSALFTALLVFGLSFMLTALAFVSRRQLEGRDYYFGEMLHYAMKSLKTVIVYPALSLIPSLVCVGFLFLMRLARNNSPGMAATLKAAYIVPMIFAIVAVLGALVYQVACMYVPAAGAVEGEGTNGSITHAWNYVRRQWGRVVLHWLIVTVAVGVITTVFLGLAAFAVKLPELIFGVSDDVKVMEAWGQFEVLQSVYRGVAYGLGMLLPVSLFSTLGMLSYIALRHPAGAQLSHSALDDTSGMAIGAMGSRPPNETTNASDTRPASPDATPPLSDISDDSDEQPLVKE